MVSRLSSGLHMQRNHMHSPAGCRTTWPVPATQALPARCLPLACFSICELLPLTGACVAPQRRPQQVLATIHLQALLKEFACAVHRRCCSYFPQAFCQLRELLPLSGPPVCVLSPQANPCYPVISHSCHVLHTGCPKPSAAGVLRPLRPPGSPHYRFTSY